MAESNGEARVVHSVTLVARERLTVTGVNDVASFDDKAVVLETPLGILTIDGSDLKIKRFGQNTAKTAQEADLIIEGSIGGVFYVDDTAEKKKRLFGRGTR